MQLQWTQLQWTQLQWTQCNCNGHNAQTKMTIESIIFLGARGAPAVVAGSEIVPGSESLDRASIVIDSIAALVEQCGSVQSIHIHTAGGSAPPVQHQRIGATGRFHSERAGLPGRNVFKIVNCCHSPREYTGPMVCSRRMVRAL